MLFTSSFFALAATAVALMMAPRLISWPMPAKGRLGSYRFYKTNRYGRRVYGKRVAYDRDSRDLGAVVVYPDGERQFFGVNPLSGKVECWGHPPPPPKPSGFGFFRR